MSKIAYDPTKDKFARWIRRSRFLRTVFFKTLDLFFLRSWYVRSSLRILYRNMYSRPELIRKAQVQSTVRDRDTTRSEKWKILDAGSGFGQYDRFMLKAFPNAEIHAIDVKEDYLEDCRSYFRKEMADGRIHFDNHDLTGDELPAEYYDLVVCVDVLEHISEDVEVMKRVHGALRPGGFLVMHSPSHFSEEDAGEDEFFVDEHARAGYSKKELMEKLQKSGMEPVSLQYSYGKWGHRAWVVLIKVPMLWFTRFGIITMIWLPLYYAFTLLPGVAMMWADHRNDNKRGTGILGIARKPESFKQTS
ncbi:MAG: methyltransferase [Balneolales bacterium]